MNEQVDRLAELVNEAYANLQNLPTEGAEETAMTPRSPHKIQTIIEDLETLHALLSRDNYSEVEDFVHELLQSSPAYRDYNPSKRAQQIERLRTIIEGMRQPKFE